MQTRTEEITSPSGPMGIHVVRPDGEGPFPVIVFFHHGPGLDEDSKETTADTANWAYYVVTHDPTESPDSPHLALPSYTGSSGGAIHASARRPRRSRSARSVASRSSFVTRRWPQLLPNGWARWTRAPSPVRTSPAQYHP
jgi:dienelactone hydrolase